MWAEYPEEVVEDYQEAYGLLYEDLELLSGAFREDNLNCELIFNCFIHLNNP